jgi:hypothetical protein
MTSSTSYFNIYRVASVLSCLIHASFVTCKRLAVPVPDLEFKDGALHDRGSIVLAYLPFMFLILKRY